MKKEDIEEIQKMTRFKRAVDKKALIEINKLLKQLDKKCIDQELMDNFEMFRNMIFHDGIVTDNQCLVNMAYDFDELMHNIDTNLDMWILQDITEKFDHMIKTNSWYCQSSLCNKIETKYDFFTKMKYHIHFEKTNFHTN